MSFGLVDDKQYNHSEAKGLLGEVREFFQKKLKIVVPEWITPTKEKTEKPEAGTVTGTFYIEKAEEPIYSACKGYDDLRGILGLFEERLENLLDNIDDLIDKNADLDEESRKSLESYASAVDKALNVYSTQKKRRADRFKELSTVAELQDELRLLFGEIIANYLITVLSDALFERIGNGAGPIYGMVAREINGFLAANGVYTKKISAGDKIEPEYVEPTPDSAENFTDDFSLFDTIDEVRRYPYFFSDGTKVIDGQARIFRRRN